MRSSSSTQEEEEEEEEEEVVVVVHDRAAAADARALSWFATHRHTVKFTTTFLYCRGLV